jgi:hypothetical protein
MSENTVLDWMDENLTIEYDLGKYHLTVWTRDNGTGGWDANYTEVYTSMHEALKGAIKIVEDNAKYDRQQMDLQEESDRWAEISQLERE